ncbi:MAG: tol-pal system YbgF family protein [Gemmatimonadota bacterium]
MNRSSPALGLICALFLTGWVADRAVCQAEDGDPDREADVWVRLLESGSGGADAVLERMAGAGGEPARALTRVWKMLVTDSSAGALRGGVILAFRLHDPQRARSLARAASHRLGEGAARELLLAYTREAERGRYPAEAAWAADRLAAHAGGRPERLRWRLLAADMSLLARDSAGARRSLAAVVDESEPEGEAHRHALERLFALAAARRGGASRAEALYRRYVSSYGDAAPALAGMKVELSRAFVRERSLQKAARILEQDRVSPQGGSHGRDRERGEGEASAILEGQRAMLALYSGRPSIVLAHLRKVVAATELEGSRRTRWIRLLVAVEAADSCEVVWLGRTLLALARAASASDAARAVPSWPEAPGSGAWPAILTVVADGLSRAGWSMESARVLRELVEAYPHAPEAPGGMLALARQAREGDPEASRRWLVRLVTTYPGSALAPVARRLLAELGPADPGS